MTENRMKDDKKAYWKNSKIYKHFKEHSGTYKAAGAGAGGLGTGFLIGALIFGGSGDSVSQKEYQALMDKADKQELQLQIVDKQARVTAINKYITDQIPRADQAEMERLLKMRTERDSLNNVVDSLNVEIEKRFGNNEVIVNDK